MSDQSRTGRPRADSEVTEIRGYVVRRREFAEGASYLTILAPSGSTLFVSKDIANGCIPSLIAAFEVGLERGAGQGFIRGRNDLRVQITKLLAMEDGK